jgi:hypothetical protein
LRLTYLKKKKLAGEVEKLKLVTPAAMKEYHKKGCYTASKLNKGELASILKVVYSISLNPKILKKLFMDDLDEKHQIDPKKLEDYRID